uniref:Uncharacterized protein n=1 Tax=Zea mays TaxID=4577 RepID=C0P2N4_MAIZE|nr:unknown [Zea mays]|eukprot:NP_001168149.1 uncharacterized protein LOC100381900 [Zea mays]
MLPARPPRRAAPSPWYPCELLLPRPVSSSGLAGCHRRFSDLASTLNRCSTPCHAALSSFAILILANFPRCFSATTVSAPTRRARFVFGSSPRILRKRKLQYIGR